MGQENGLQLLKGLFYERRVKNCEGGGGMTKGELRLQSDATGRFWTWEGVTVWYTQCLKHSDSLGKC